MARKKASPVKKAVAPKTKAGTPAAVNVRSILKDLDAFEFDLRDKEQDGSRTTYTYDIFYRNMVGTFTIAKDEEKEGDHEADKIVVAALNLSMGKIISLVNDANIRKLAEYVLENTK
jgi:hypothetical protein